MARNKIQFQIGLSLPEFIVNFGSEQQCEAHLEKIKWPQGFKCRHCQSSRVGIYRDGSRKVYQCKDCRQRERLTAGTLFHRTKIPLLKWFIGIREICQAKNCISALELHRHLDVNYKTAWLMKQKIMQLMFESEAKFRLCGKVEIDEVYFGEIPKVEYEEISLEKAKPFIAAVQCDVRGNPKYVKFTCVKAFNKENIHQWAAKNLKKGSHTVTNCHKCFKKLDEFGPHSVLLVKRGKKKTDAEFRWEKTILSNVKTSILGTYHSINFKKYGFRYLVDLEFRLNRRFDLKRMFYGLVKKALKCSPRPVKTLNALLSG